MEGSGLSWIIVDYLWIINEKLKKQTQVMEVSGLSWIIVDYLWIINEKWNKQVMEVHKTRVTRCVD